jgi:hypothetical protein
MRKKILRRCLLGAPIGMTISTFIAIAISVSVGDGGYYPVVPQLAADCGGELNAVLLQTACSLLYGAAWAGASVIWEREDWSLLRQSAAHLTVCSLATFPVAYFMRWMRHSVSGALIYFGTFFAVYLLCWLCMYFAIKKRVNELNSKLRENGAHN